MDKKSVRSKISALVNQYGIYMMFVLLVIASSLISPKFLTYKNLISVSKQISVTAVMAFGMTLLIISGQIDLSMGATVAMAGMVSINAFLSTGSYVFAFVVACIIAMLIGYINGHLITTLKLPGFIATMSMDIVVRGAVYLYTGGSPIYQIGEYGKVSTTYVGVFPLPVIIMVIVGIVCFIILKYTRFGRSLYACGGNIDAAEASGINVGRVKRMAFLVSGAFVGIAAVLQMARLNSGLPDTAEGYHADAIASAVIGGTSFTGGTGTAIGTIVGAFIIGIISNILNLCGVQSYVQQIVKGAIIITVVSFDLLGKARKIRKIQKA